MINLLVGTVPQGSPFAGRYCLLLDGPDMHAKYTRDGTILAQGRMLNNSEKKVFDPELGELLRTEIALQIKGIGKCEIHSVWPILDCTMKHNLRFYRIPPKKV